jgi:hypothetical protein
MTLSLDLTDEGIQQVSVFFDTIVQGRVFLNRFLDIQDEAAECVGMGNEFIDYVVHCLPLLLIMKSNLNQRHFRGEYRLDYFHKCLPSCK